ncbi:PXA domain-containing protein [Aspergillus aurantiobrunneus]
MDVSNDASTQSQSDQAQHIERPTSNDDTNHGRGSQSGTDNSDGTPLKQLVGMTLQFLSTCCNETLLLILVCLMGATYIILGRLGLLLIGAVLGVALHASWEGAENGHSSASQNSSRKQLSLNIVHKLLEWKINQRIETSPNNGNPGEINTENESDMDVDISSLGPMTAAALHLLIDAAVRDYVNYWYEPILPSESTFPISCRRVLSGFVTSITSHLCRKRTADTFLEFLTNSSSMIIVFLNELCTAFGTAGPNVTAEDAVLQYLESNPESSLSSLLAHQQQHKKLKTISDDILSRFLDSGAYNCIPVQNFLREVLTRLVFESTISSMSRPEFINGWITYLFSEGESEIMNAIDAGVEGARNHGVAGAKIPGETSEPASIHAGGSVAGSSLSSRVPSQAPNKVDQATEEAMLEAKRLTDMIAAQDIPKRAEQTIQDGVLEENNSRDGDNIIANVAVGSPARERASNEESPLETDPAGKAQDAQVKSSELVGSLTSPSIQSSGISTNSPSDSLDITPAFTLHRASITVDDSFDPGDKTLLRSKPTSDYLIQVEPHSGRSSGWMVIKKYVDFESIHETLGTIARLNQLRFGDSHSLVPSWKGRTRQALAGDLERYLQDALQFQPLAESATMRRFFERDGALGIESGDPSIKPGFAFPGQATFGNVGKGVLDVLTNAPKGVSGGGKAVLEGVTGVFSGGSNKKTPVAPSADGGGEKSGGALHKNASSLKGENSTQQRDLRLSSDATNSTFSFQLLQPGGTDGLALPSETGTFTESSNTSLPTPESGENVIDGTDGRVSFDATSVHKSNSAANPVSPLEEKNSNGAVPVESIKSTEIPAGRKGQSRPITADETRIAVELLFAIINELYSLSSAWNIRRTLLNAAKSYILRPGNPSLETIRGLLQDSMIDSHTTDEAIGMYLAKIRENALPTADELSSWPPAMSTSEKRRQRDAARQILLQKGLPQAITSVMGAVASREALSKVFDSLQVEVVARGLVFSVLLQALRAVVL